MHIEDIEYFSDDQRFVGQLAVDDSRDGARPAVLVSHEGGGLDDHAKNIARRLAELGYTAFALDYFGDGKPPAPDERMERFTRLAGDPGLIRRMVGPGSRSCWPATTRMPAGSPPSASASAGRCPSSWPARAPT